MAGRWCSYSAPMAAASNSASRPLPVAGSGTLSTFMRPAGSAPQCARHLPRNVPLTSTNARPEEMKRDQPRSSRLSQIPDHLSLVLCRTRLFSVGKGERTMIDVRRVRAHPEEMRGAIRKRRVNPEKANLDRWLELDRQKRSLETVQVELNTERNQLAQLGRSNPAAARERGQELRRRGRELEEQLTAITAEWQEIIDWFPNWPDPGMPEGESEQDNREEKI